MRDIRDGWRMVERKEGRKFAESYINYLRKARFTRTINCVRVRCAIVFLVMPVVLNNAMQVTSFFQWSR